LVGEADGEKHGYNNCDNFQVSAVTSDNCVGITNIGYSNHGVGSQDIFTLSVLS